MSLKEALKYEDNQNYILISLLYLIKNIKWEKFRGFCICNFLGSYNWFLDWVFEGFIVHIYW